ncbi:PREDICTED: zinc metalloproteinase nas-4-like [Nicrophorus vespilloides]|uniref:Metalloendopeptidase n=1 Tax=Nicrophorus vespilloides TaxID=110193 RepID=A0ABM1NHS5_NICVS|nr:PREDICTED: zinc metalloproteinase nas-4-like [Nicrophorus vespilloides]
MKFMYQTRRFCVRPKCMPLNYSYGINRVPNRLGKYSKRSANLQKMYSKILGVAVLVLAVTAIPLPDILSDDDDMERTEMNIEETGKYFEGDIILPSGRNGLIDANTHWDNGIVPYEILGSFTTKEMNMISDAMDAYHQYTCIRFVPHIATDENYISITSDKTGCWSSVGKTGGQQKVNLETPGCVTKIGTVIHELMHAIGFTHEQNRSDRDEHVQIRFENIADGYKSKYNYAITSKLLNIL